MTKNIRLRILSVGATIGVLLKLSGIFFRAILFSFPVKSKPAPQGGENKKGTRFCGGCPNQSISDMHLNQRITDTPVIKYIR